MQTINYDALLKNAEYFKSIIGDSKLCAVVKNDAYGHGIERIARYLVDVVDCFAVGSAQEAEKISGLGKDILILLPQHNESLLLALKLNCIITVDSFETLEFLRYATEKQLCNARIHIKINSGMSRLGFDEADLSELLNKLSYCKSITIEGVYSHFWGDDILECDKQFNVFMRCVKYMEESLKKPLVKHIANTTGALLSSKYRLDMVRIGLGLYGYGDKNLSAVKKVTANVVAVRQVKKGDVVGYGGKYVCNTDRTIAIVDVGYAQGLARTLVNSKVLAANKRLFPIVSICMAMSMVDVTGASVAVGDEIELVGSGVNMSNNSIIIYEILCNLH